MGGAAGGGGQNKGKTGFLSDEDYEEQSRTEGKNPKDNMTAAGVAVTDDDPALGISRDVEPGAEAGTRRRKKMKMKKIKRTTGRRRPRG